MLKLEEGGVVYLHWQIIELILDK